jgi:hypothetical protein
MLHRPGQEAGDAGLGAGDAGAGAGDAGAGAGDAGGGGDAWDRKAWPTLEAGG